jgi:hypothetical protein
MKQGQPLIAKKRGGSARPVKQEAEASNISYKNKPLGNIITPKKSGVTSSLLTLEN